MKTSKHILTGLGVAAVATALASFSGEKTMKNGDDDKKKKYHVIHQEDGKVQEYDTIIPMDSEYSVADFLASKGIDDAEAKIVTVPSPYDRTFHKQDGEKSRVIMHSIDEEVTVDHEDGTKKEVKIIREEDENGQVTTKKFVNGKEVEVTEEDLKNIRHHKDGKHQKVFVKTDDDAVNWTSEGGEENIEIEVEMDDKGNMQVQKFVNGKEVAISEEEMEQIESGNGNVFILHEEGGEDVDMDALLEELEMEVEMIENEEELEDGQKRIIVKEVRMETEKSVQSSDKIKKDIRIEQNVEVAGGDEDFTVVLVHENYDAAADENVAVVLRNEENSGSDVAGMSLNAPISVYPNPNKGTFTLAFEQKKAVKTAIRVVDAEGKTVFKEKLGDFSGSYKKELNLKKHGAGIYIVTVQQGDESSSRKVIVE